MEKNPTWMAVVAAAISDGEGRWLMQRRPRGKHHGGLWEFPGGKVEAFEKPVEALVRELDEELSLQIGTGDCEPAFFAEGRGPNPAIPIVILLYTIHTFHGEPKTGEGAEIGWFSPSEILLADKPPLDSRLADSLFSAKAP